MSELEELKHKATELKRRNAERHKGRYNYAKSLGFNPSEAAVLMGRSKKYIDQLVFEKEVANGETTQANS